MKILHLSIILTIIGISVLVISNIGPVAAPLMGESVEQLYKESDIIVLGKIVSLDEIPDKQMTAYTIAPEEYLKPKNHGDENIVAQGLGTKNISFLYYRSYAIGDRALFFLEKKDDHYVISPYSYVTKSNCNATQLLTVEGFHPGYFAFSQGNNTDQLYTNEPINVTGYAYNYIDLKPKDEETKFTIHTPTGDILTATRQIHIEACQGFAQSSWSFVPTIPGVYSISASSYSKNETISGGAVSGVSIINRNGSSGVPYPVKQPQMISNKTNVEIEIAKGSSEIGCETNNSCYKPDKVLVGKGTKIMWRNYDFAAHTVTNGQPADALTGNVFDSNLITSGQTYEFVFNDTGTYNYYCQVHPWMTGIVVVTNNFQSLNATSNEKPDQTLLYGQLNLGGNITGYEALHNHKDESVDPTVLVLMIGIPILVIAIIASFLTRKRK